MNKTEIKEKRCSKCKEILPVEKFYRNKTKKDGLHDSCKECQLATNKLYKEKYPDRYKRSVKKTQTKKKAYLTENLEDSWGIKRISKAEEESIEARRTVIENGKVIKGDGYENLSDGVLNIDTVKVGKIYATPRGLRVKVIEKREGYNYDPLDRVKLRYMPDTLILPPHLLRELDD